MATGHEAVPDWQRAYHARIDPHRRASSLSDIVLGGQDGIVGVLGVVLGVAAAGASPRIVLAAGVATAFAESISMAAVAYTSTLAEADVYRGERAREYRHLRAVPALERAEVRELYARKGFAGEMLDRIVDTITADPDVWVAVMMSEEHGLAPVSRGHALRSALVVGAAAMLGSLLPVAPFAVVARTPLAEWDSGVIAAVALFALGAYKARLTVGHVLRAGLELAAIGTASALAGWGIGALFGTF
jgi:VIT1/CCC1 family predicted Fe2+/Mn2+ transporter